MSMEERAGTHPALPLTATVEPDGVLSVGACRVDELAERFGTPLYLYDVSTLDAAATRCREALGTAGTAHYACKAYLARWLCERIHQAGLGLDVCSGTELQLALGWGFPASRIRLHGNNKPLWALRLAAESRIGAVVVDSDEELQILSASATRLGRRVAVLLRLNPGIEAHTHRYLQTGVPDSKFGIAIAGGEAAITVQRALKLPGIDLQGYHAHIGTQILDLEPYRLLMRCLLSFADAMERTTGYWPSHLSPGGGIGIAYTGEQPPSIGAWLGTLRQELEHLTPRRRPHLSVEPGRGIVGQAGLALYRVGAIKRLPQGTTFVSVDGGMADNIRPALYEAQYAALAASKMREPTAHLGTIVGPYCESGDILVRDAPLPALARGDLIAIPACGAYCLPMSSNYNGALRPAVITVRGGEARLVQRRQRIDDLSALETE